VLVADAQRAAEQVGVTIDELAAIYLLDSVKYLGPQAFKELHEAGCRPLDACENPEKLPTKGKRRDKIRKQLIVEVQKDQKILRDRAVRQILAAHKHNAHIVTYHHPSYPRNVYESNYPAPVLYVRGSLKVLGAENTVACVGTRKIRPPYSDWENDFVRFACSHGFAIVSGFALGADTIGHETAWKTNGKTICVMPGGLDRPFPPENRPLWNSLLEYSSVSFVTESSFGTSASSLTLRKRNKLIVAFSRGVLVLSPPLRGAP
jgi:predicted Rossmann fold nucleotide-binding protein DprA/Smf involved in DNA uptake